MANGLKSRRRQQRNEDGSNVLNGNSGTMAAQTSSAHELGPSFEKELDNIRSHERKHLNDDYEYPESGSTSPDKAPSTPKDQSIGEVVSVSSPSPSSNGKVLGYREKRRYRFRNISTEAKSPFLEKQSSRNSNFFGFYVLFWVTVAVLFIREVCLNYARTSKVIGENITGILKQDLIWIGLTDLAMYLTSYFGVFLQLAIKNGYLSWQRSGWIIQGLWQIGYLIFYLWIADYLDFPWIGSEFLLLHSLVLIMKQHSYAFYNGYFWGVLKERDLCKKLLSVNSETAETKDKQDLEERLQFCEEEIRSQSDTITFPENITFSNFFMYSMYPTVVYQIYYPRNDRIRWGYVGEKVCAIFGVFFLMIILAEDQFYPIAMRAMALRSEPMSVKIKHYPLILADIIPPFIVMYVLTFYIIWDAILNSIAELTRFADREFYGPWWNSVSWDTFSKEWNVPVHRFLLRHVYHSSLSALHISKSKATVLTFLISSVVHELAMYVIFKRIRGYLFILQMSQVPMIILSRTKFMKGRYLLGNAIFWIGICTGPSLMCSLYLTF